MRPGAEGQAEECGQEEGLGRDRLRLSFNLGPGQQGSGISQRVRGPPPLLSRDMSQVPAAPGPGHLAGSGLCGGC